MPQWNFEVDNSVYKINKIQFREDIVKTTYEINIKDCDSNFTDFYNFIKKNNGLSISVNDCCDEMYITFEDENIPPLDFNEYSLDKNNFNDEEYDKYVKIMGKENINFARQAFDFIGAYLF
jgi:hypothetical protein